VPPEQRTNSFFTFLTFVTIGIQTEPGNIATYIDLIFSKIVMPRNSIFSSKSIISSNCFLPRNGSVDSNASIFSNAIFLSSNISSLPQRYSSCTGAYYMFFSFAGDDLPKNSSLPVWIRDIGDVEDSIHRQYPGDVFLVKMAPHEYEEKGWAAYEDIVPDFLECLNEGPLTVT
jgi:hypothetical protein